MDKQQLAAFDAVGFMMEYELGDMHPDEIIDGFQSLLDAGLIPHLQGSYQRMAQQLLDAGQIKRR